MHIKCIIVVFSELLFPVTHVMFLPEALLWCYSASTLNSLELLYLLIDLTELINTLTFFKNIVEIA